jgi:hypothetical protein
MHRLDQAGFVLRGDVNLLVGWLAVNLQGTDSFDLEGARLQANRVNKAVLDSARYPPYSFRMWKL